MEDQNAAVRDVDPLDALGKDLIVEVPIGTVVYKVTGPRVKIADLTYDGQEEVIARGGDGGFGHLWQP